MQGTHGSISYIKTCAGTCCYTASISQHYMHYFRNWTSGSALGLKPVSFKACSTFRYVARSHQPYCMQINVAEAERFQQLGAGSQRIPCLAPISPFHCHAHVIPFGDYHLSRLSVGRYTIELSRPNRRCRATSCVRNRFFRRFATFCVRRTI